MSDPAAVLAQLLSPPQAETLGAAGQSSWATAAATLAGLLGSSPALDGVAARLVMPDEILGDFGDPHLVLPFEISTDTDQNATAYAIAPSTAAAVFFDSLADDEADQEHQTIVVASTMLGQVAQALNALFMTASPAGLVVALDDVSANTMPPLLAAMDDPALLLSASLRTERALPFSLLLPGTFLDILAQALPGAPAAGAAPEAVPAAAAPEPQAAAAKEPFAIDPSLGFTLSAEEIENAELIDEASEPLRAPAFAGTAAQGAPRREPTPIAAAKARFSPLPEPEPSYGRNGIDLLAGLRMNVPVELGRTELPVAGVLGLGPGSVVELDRLAGEPVDILVNDRLIARGEVVVVDENFGVRVVEVVRRGTDVQERAG